MQRDQGDETFATGGQGLRVNLPEAARRLSNKCKFAGKPVPIPYNLLRRLLAGNHKTNTAPAWGKWFPGDPTPDVRREVPRQGGRHEATIPETDIEAIRRLIVRELKRGEELRTSGYRRCGQLWRDLQLATIARRRELAECLDCWATYALLKPEAALFIRQGKSRRWGKQTHWVQLRRYVVYPPERVRELWRTDYLKAGVRKLKDLLAGGQCDAKDVHEAMGPLGIAGRRLGLVRRKVGAIIRPAGDGSQRKVYALPGQAERISDPAVHAPPPDEPEQQPTRLGGARAKYPGHTRRRRTRGPEADPARETVLEFCYDEYIVERQEQSQVLREAQRFGPRYAPNTTAEVRVMARQWAGRWDPPLPLNRGGTS